MSAQNGRWKDRMSQSDLDAVDRGIPATAPRGKGSHEDSAVEGDGFEISVPGRDTVKPSWEADCSRSGSGSVGEPKVRIRFPPAASPTPCVSPTLPTGRRLPTSFTPPRSK